MGPEERHGPRPPSRPCSEPVLQRCPFPADPELSALEQSGLSCVCGSPQDPGLRQGPSRFCGVSKFRDGSTALLVPAPGEPGAGRVTDCPGLPRTEAFYGQCWAHWVS